MLESCALKHGVLSLITKIRNQDGIGLRSHSEALTSPPIHIHKTSHVFHTGELPQKALSRLGSGFLHYHQPLSALVPFQSTLQCRPSSIPVLGSSLPTRGKGLCLQFSLFFPASGQVSSVKCSFI